METKILKYEDYPYPIKRDTLRKKYLSKDILYLNSLCELIDTVLLYEFKVLREHHIIHDGSIWDLLIEGHWAFEKITEVDSTATQQLDPATLTLKAFPENESRWVQNIATTNERLLKPEQIHFGTLRIDIPNSDKYYISIADILYQNPDDYEKIIEDNIELLTEAIKDLGKSIQEDFKTLFDNYIDTDL